MKTVTDAKGHVTRYTYDKTGNVLTADYAGEQSETNTYNELGLLTTVTTAEGDTLYQYDEASRLISVTQPNGETVSYTYDSRGNRATMTYPNGKTVSYSYDEMNRLIAVKGVDGATTKYEYDALGRRIRTDGVKEDTTYTYDEVGNLVSQTTTGAYDLALEYAYDLSGRMTSESRTENGATLTSVFTYDPLGQLTGFTRSDGQSETYTYDPAGNMTAKTKNGVQTTMRYNAANQLISSVSGTEKTTYSYDANGNLTRSESAAGARSYAYNALGLLAQFTREDGYTESYSYNANRLLSGITNKDGTTTLTYDILYGDGVVIRAAQNGEQTSYTYGLERISAITGNTRTEYVYDGRGSVAAELSYNDSWYTFGGGVARKNVTSKSYTPFGEQIGEAVSGYGYNGEYYSAATGMIYLRARFYEPDMNRFGQKDTLRGSIADGISLNRYLYCQSDPVNFKDVNGLQAVAVGGGGGVSANVVRNQVQARAQTAIAARAVSTTGTGTGGYTSAASAASVAKDTVSSVFSSGSTTQSAPTAHSSSSYTSNQTSGITKDVPEVELPVWSKITHVCEKVLTSKPAQTILNTYLGYLSFNNGMTAALIRNYGQTGVNLIGALEYLITGETKDADRLQSSLNAEIRSYENNSNNDLLYTAGLVVGDLNGIAIDVLVAYFSGGASAGLKAAGTIGKSGTALAVVAETVSVTGIVVEGAGIIDALKQSFNLGNDINDLVSEIRGSSETSHSYLSRQEKNRIKNRILSGEDIHFETKEQALEFIEEKFPDFQQEIAGARSAEGWHFDSHPFEEGGDIVEHINIYSKEMGFRVHITWG